MHAWHSMADKEESILTNIFEFGASPDDIHAPKFVPWPKTPRLNGAITISEKIDGTNGAIIVTPDGRVAAQSRNRLVTPGKDTDNYGFAAWVYENAGVLRDTLGVGHHFGEWAGRKIGRGYELEERTFFLFNPRWLGEVEHVGRLQVAPQLQTLGAFDSFDIAQTLAYLVAVGSHVDGGKTAPEGIIVYHHASRQVFKVLAENDHKPKGMAGRREHDTLPAPVEVMSLVSAA